MGISITGKDTAYLSGGIIVFTLIIGALSVKAFGITSSSGLTTMVVVIAGLLYVRGLMIRIYQANMNSTANSHAPINNELASEAANPFDKFSTLTELEALNIAILPVWSKQIETSRTQVSTAINELSDRFQGVVEKLGDAVNTSEQTAGDFTTDGHSVSQLIKHSSKELLAVVNFLQTTIASKNDLLEQLRGLKQLSEEMQGMAKAVRKIAENTNLLALNAAIEAARAGEYGRGFSIVADEVRTLSKLSSETGTKMSKQITTITGTIEKVLTTAEHAIVKESQNNQQSDKTIHQVLDSFQQITSGLSQSADVLRQESCGIKTEIEDILVSLQFEDRVTQMLRHVTKNMDKLEDLLITNETRYQQNETPLAINAQEWMQQLMAAYTTAEERSNQSGKNGANASDVVFF